MEAVLLEDAVLLTICKYLPCACVKLRKVCRSFAHVLPEDRLELLLPQLFELHDLFSKDPFQICLDGEVDQLWLMVVHGLNLKARDSNGGTLLQSAVMCAEFTRAKKLISLLIERGASINAKGSFGYTPLHALAGTDLIETATFILGKGANVDALSQNGSTPLLIASREGRVDMVVALLKHGADPDDGGDKGWAPLFIAAADGFYDVVRSLLEYGADPNMQLYVSLIDM
jgi:ankyrin repeat protein